VRLLFCFVLFVVVVFFGAECTGIAKEFCIDKKKVNSSVPIIKDVEDILIIIVVFYVIKLISVYIYIILQL